MKVVKSKILGNALEECNILYSKTNKGNMGRKQGVKALEKGLVE